MAETPMQAMTGIGEGQKKEILMELATGEPRHATTVGEDDKEDQGGGPERHPSLAAHRGSNCMPRNRTAALGQLNPVEKPGRTAPS